MIDACVYVTITRAMQERHGGKDVSANDTRKKDE